MSKDTHVWVRDGFKLKRVLRSYAKSSGLEIDTRCGHDLSGGVAPAKKMHMTPHQKEIFYHQTGKRIDDLSQADRAVAEAGLHIAEPGEASYDLCDALKEHTESGKSLDKRFSLENLDLWGDADRKRAEAFDAGERYRYHSARLRERGIVPRDGDQG